MIRFVASLAMTELPAELQEAELSETYWAQMEAAMRAGWGDPLMDDYDRYDELRGQDGES